MLHAAAVLKGVIVMKSAIFSGWLASKALQHSLYYVFIFVVSLFIILDAMAEDGALVYVIDIRTEIGTGVSSYIGQGIQNAEKSGADVIIFDVDTPGGRVDSAVKIIRSIQGTQLPTIAFVNRQAISAGAMISAACAQIVMTPGGTIGDSAPVDIQGNEAGEKAISYIRATIRATAERQNRNPDIAEAMVDKELILVRYSDGQIVKLLPEEYITESEDGREMEILCAEGKLLTMTTRQALEYEFVDARAENLTNLLAQYQIVQIDGRNVALTEEDILQKQTERGVSQVTRMKSLAGADVQKFAVTLADRIVFFLTSPLISSLLLSLGVLGIFIEIRTPGFGIPGFLGLLCIGLFFGGHMLTQLEAEWAALAFLLGLALIALEVFVIPGFGVAGIIGIILMLGSVFFVFKNAYEFGTAVQWLSLSVITTCSLAILAAWMLPKTGAFRRFALPIVMDANMGYHSAGSEDFQSYLGKIGVALTPLRPAGKARIDNKRVDVITEGDFIARDTKVKVLDVEGPKIFVEALDD